MSIVRIEALKALKAVIAAAVPALTADNIIVGQAPSGRTQTYPTLTLGFAALSFEPAQEIESATIGPATDGVVVFNVGAWSGPLQMRIVATTVGERYELEQAVLDCFLAREGAPGVIVTPITSTPDLGDWIAAFELDSSQWIDVDAFDRKLESVITVNAVVPALTVRTHVYEITTLVLGLTEDFDAVFTPSTLTPPAAEVVQIHDDGSITPYTP